MMLDFSLAQYERLCLSLLDSGYRTLTVEGYLQGIRDDEQIAILRHDVDRFPGCALEMAFLESELGIRSTYYFRHVRGVFLPEIIIKISKLGHEVGYHYETLSKTRGNAGKAIQLFEQELENFRSFIDIRTICMHGSPLTPHDNRELWSRNDFQQFHILGEAYLSIDYGKVRYFTDTGRSWNSIAANIRDRPSQVHFTENIHSTQDLISAIHKKIYLQLCMATHPERWRRSWISWSISWALDQTANLIKAVASTLAS